LVATATPALAFGVVAQETATVTSEDVDIAQEPTSEGSVSVDATGGVSAADVTVSVDTSVAEITDARQGEGIGEQTQVEVVEETPGSVTFEYTDISASERRFEIGVVEYTAVSGGEETPIELETANFNDGDFEAFGTVNTDEGTLTTAEGVVDNEDTGSEKGDDMEGGEGNEADEEGANGEEGEDGEDGDGDGDNADEGTEENSTNTDGEVEEGDVSETEGEAGDGRADGESGTGEDRDDGTDGGTDGSGTDETEDGSGSQSGTEEDEGEGTAADDEAGDGGVDGNEGGTGSEGLPGFGVVAALVAVSLYVALRRAE